MIIECEMRDSPVWRVAHINPKWAVAACLLICDSFGQFKIADCCCWYVEGDRIYWITLQVDQKYTSRCPFKIEEEKEGGKVVVDWLCR